MRFAKVNASAREVKPYLPGNYEVVAEWGPLGPVLVGGRDRAGWTLDDYVLPRLASGLHFGKEIPVE